MTPVATKFEDRTFTYRQLARQGMIALYEQHHKRSGICRYEVVRLRQRPAHRWPTGTVTPAHEQYPGNEDWGTYGWTYHTRAEADRALQTLAICKEAA